MISKTEIIARQLELAAFFFRKNEKTDIKRNIELVKFLMQLLGQYRESIKNDNRN